MMLSSELRVAASRRSAKFCLLRTNFHQSRTLTDVIRRSPGLHRLYRSLIVIHRCDQNDGGVRRNAVRVAQHLDAINIRHFDVGDNDVVQSAVYFVFCALP